MLAGSGSARAVKELTVDIVVPEGRKCNPVIVVWHDGMRAELNDLTVKTWEEMLAGHNDTGRDSNIVWTGTHKVTHSKLEVTSRQDRRPIAILREQERQILQVNLRVFLD